MQQKINNFMFYYIILKRQNLKKHFEMSDRV
jgi:hypothetical protein